jgi:hypothetical protein
MTGLYWRDGAATIAAYSSASKGDRSVVKIELTVSDPYELGSLLSQLAEQKRAQAQVPKPAPKAKKPPPLMLTDRRGLDRPLDDKF